MPFVAEKTSSTSVFLSKEELAVLAKLPMPPALPQAPVRLVLERPPSPGFMASKETKDKHNAYMASQKAYPQSNPKDQQEAYAKKSEEYKKQLQEYEQRYAKYAEAFTTPLAQLLIVPKGKNPPVLDYRDLGQNFVRVLNRQEYASSSKGLKHQTKEKYILPFPQLLTKFAKAGDPVLEKLSQGQIVEVSDLKALWRGLRERVSLATFAPDHESAQSIILIMQILNLFRSQEFERLPGLGESFNKKVEDILPSGIRGLLWLASGPKTFNYDGAKSLRANFLDNEEKLVKIYELYGKVLDGFLEAYLMPAPPLSDATAEDKIANISAEIAELEKVRRDFTIVTPIGRYAPTPLLEDYIKALSEKREQLKKMQADHRPASPVKLPDLGINISPGPPQSSTQAVVAQLSSHKTESVKDYQPPVTPTPSMSSVAVAAPVAAPVASAASVVVTLTPVSDVSPEKEKRSSSPSDFLDVSPATEKRSSSPFGAGLAERKQRRKQHQQDDVKSFAARAVRVLDKMYDDIGAIQDEIKKNEVKFERNLVDFIEYKASLHQLHHQVVALAKQLEHVDPRVLAQVDPEERKSINTGLTKLTASIEKLEETAALANRSQEFKKRSEALDEQAASAAVKHRVAEDKAKALGVALSNTVRTLDKAVEDQKQIISELKDYLAKAGVTTSGKKINLAKDLIAALEMTVESGRVEKKLITSQYEVGVNVSRQKSATNLFGGIKISADKGAEISVIRRSDRLLPSVTSMENAAKAIASAKERFTKAGLREKNSTLLDILNKAVATMKYADVKADQTAANKCIDDANADILRAMKTQAPSPGSRRRDGSS